VRERLSELERRRGLILRGRYGLVQCVSCPFLLIVRSGQKMGRCPRCGRRFWLHGAFVVATSDSWERLRMLIPRIWGNIGSGKWRFLPELGVV
jgi:ribosomal protein L37AE/L43A